MNKIITLFLTCNLALLTSCCCLNSTSTNLTENNNPGRALIRESIQAHGGIDSWRNNGALKFRWTYNMTDVGKVVDTIQIVEPNSMSAKHSTIDKKINFGFQNGSFWIQPKEASFFPPAKFWTHTPIYFIGIPFIFEDDNANFELLEKKRNLKKKTIHKLK